MTCWRKKQIQENQQMSLDRVIAEQQKKIDDLTEANKKLIERAANVFKKNDELFEAVARLIDFRMDFDEHKWEDKKREAYCSLRHEVRMQMIEAGYCVTCYNFMAHCECDYE
jgi:succinate dehydrogenase/fumarate reductase flavoprotein subunit